MLGANHLLEYLKDHGITNAVLFSDGALKNPVHFPLAAVETHGAILFADLPGYSKHASQLEPAECACLVSHFFAWFEGEAGRHFGGFVDKFIGDEVMVVFPQDKCKLPPLQAAMHTARAMLEFDPYAFDPKIGIAVGPFAIALVGTQQTASVTAVGPTVNLAARCVAGLNERAIRIATAQLAPVKEVFSDDDVWTINGPTLFEPKNMDPVQVIYIERMTRWVPNFDYFEDVKKKVKNARLKGAIRSE